MGRRGVWFREWWRLGGRLVRVEKGEEGDRVMGDGVGRRLCIKSFQLSIRSFVRLSIHASMAKSAIKFQTRQLASSICCNHAWLIASHPPVSHNKATQLPSYQASQQDTALALLKQVLLMSTEL